MPWVSWGSAELGRGSMDVTTAAAPWWYVAALAGGFTILGSVVTLFSTWRSDKRKFRRDAQHRWEGEIRKHIARLLASSWQAFTLAHEVEEVLIENVDLLMPPSKALGRSKVSVLVKQSFGVRKLLKGKSRITTKSDASVRAVEQAYEAYAELTLIAPKALIKLADELFEALIAVAEFSETEEGRQRLDHDYKTKRDAMVDWARALPDVKLQLEGRYR